MKVYSTTDLHISVFYIHSKGIAGENSEFWLK